jgi:hypothetical protein
MREIKKDSKSKKIKFNCRNLKHIEEINKIFLADQTHTQKFKLNLRDSMPNHGIFNSCSGSEKNGLEMLVKFIYPSRNEQKSHLLY